MKKVDNYLEEAIGNIRKDREITKELLNDLIVYLSADESRHKDVGQIAAKYVETLQRSNEQLVKITAIIHKRQRSATELNESDKREIFDLIKSEK